MSTKCHVLISLSDFDHTESADALGTAIAGSARQAARKVGASPLVLPRMPYRDLGRSPKKTLGRPTGRVKAFCVPLGVPFAAHGGRACPCQRTNAIPAVAGSRRPRTLIAADMGPPKAQPSAYPRPRTSRVMTRQIAATGEYGPGRGHRASSPLIAAIRGWEAHGGGGGLLRVSLLHQGCPAPSILALAQSNDGLAPEGVLVQAD